MLTSFIPPPPPVVQYQLLFLSNVCLPTTQAIQDWLNFESNYSSSAEEYIQLVRLIAAIHAAKQHKKSFKPPCHNLVYLSYFPTFESLQPIVPLYKG